MEELNSTSSYENDSYVYDYEDVLISMCKVDDYNKTTGVCYATIFCLSILGHGFLMFTLTCYEDWKGPPTFSCSVWLFRPSVHTDVAFLVRGASSSLGFWWHCLQDHDWGLFCRHLRKPHPSHSMTLDRFVVVVVRSYWLTTESKAQMFKSCLPLVPGS